MRAFKQSQLVCPGGPWLQLGTRINAQKSPDSFQTQVWEKSKLSGQATKVSRGSYLVEFWVSQSGYTWAFQFG